MTRLLAPSFADFRASWVRPDLIAGLTVWAVLVPESLAYATIAGVSPVVGLYAAIPALVLYALVGSSRHLVVSPMSATAALSVGVVGTVADDPAEFAALTAGLALTVGLVALAAGFLRLGFLASFISEPVLKGFVVGLALTIMIGQLPSLVGVDKGDGDFFEKAWDLIRALPDTDALTLAVGLGSLLALLALRRWLPFVPGALVVALVAIVLTALLGLEDRGLDIVGHIDSGLPDLGLPDITGGQFLELLGAAGGVMLVGFAEGLGAAKSYAARSGYDIEPDRELLGLGMSNLGAGLASGMVVNGSLSKTAVNGSAGARSELSTITAAALTVLTLLFLTGLFEQLPEATLAAIVVVAVIELIDVASMHRLWRAGSGRLARAHRITARADFVAAATALLGVLLFDTLPGLVIGVAASLVLLIARTSRPHVAVLVPAPGADVGPGGERAWVDIGRHPDAAAVPGALVVRVEAPLMFANADYVRTRVRELATSTTDLRLVVLDGRTTPSIDVTAADMLVQLRADLRRTGADLVLAENVGQVRDVLGRTAEEPAAVPTIEAALSDLHRERVSPPEAPATQAADRTDH